MTGNVPKHPNSPKEGYVFLNLNKGHKEILIFVDKCKGNDESMEVTGSDSETTMKLYQYKSILKILFVHKSHTQSNFHANYRDSISYDITYFQINVIYLLRKEWFLQYKRLLFSESTYTWSLHITKKKPKHILKVVNNKKKNDN